MRMSNWLAGAATCLLMPVAAAIEFPKELDISVHVADVRISRAAGTVASHVDPVLAQVTDAPSFVRSDFASGKLRGSAFIQDAFGDFVLSTASLAVELRNNSAAVLSLDPGKVKLTVDATFQHSLGAESLGTVGNTLVANLAAVVVDAVGSVRSSGATNIVYRYADSVDDAPADLSLLTDVQGGFSFATPVFNADELAVDLLSSALTVLPGETLALSVLVSGTATAFAFFGGTGFSATTDFGNTASLLLDLPPGFQVRSDVPLSWVTTTPVPEPASAMLLVAGLALLWRRRAGRARGAPAP